MWCVVCGLWIESLTRFKPQTTNYKPHLVLEAVGDIMLDRYVGRVIDREGVTYPLARVRKTLKDADLIVANLECPLTNHPKAFVKEFEFRVPPNRVTSLVGIGLVSIANNHTLDCGPEGLSDTLDSLSKAGILSCGSSRDPVIVERNGLKVAFIGFSDFLQRSDPEGLGMNYYRLGDLTTKIKKARSKADVVILFAHWGAEGSSIPTASQRREAKELSAAGADLILGSHPHVLQPVERIGKTVVAYSMGNFIFDAIKPKQAETAIFSFTLSARCVENFRVIPCHIERARPVPGRSSIRSG